MYTSCTCLYMRVALRIDRKKVARYEEHICLTCIPYTIYVVYSCIVRIYIYIQVTSRLDRKKWPVPVLKDAMDLLEVSFSVFLSFFFFLFCLLFLSWSRCLCNIHVCVELCRDSLVIIPPRMDGVKGSLQYSNNRWIVPRCLMILLPRMDGMTERERGIYFCLFPCLQRGLSAAFLYPNIFVLGIQPCKILTRRRVFL